MIYEKIPLTTAENTAVTLDAYSPEVKTRDDRSDLRAGIVICAGGGYAYVSERESEPVALRFAAMGFNTYVIHYRTAPDRFPSAVQDIAGAVAWVREHAERWLQHPDRIALMGFSAGGHAACTLGVLWQRSELWAPISRTPEQVQPNAMILCYPVITAGPKAHRDSFVNLTGTDDPEAHRPYSLETLVNPRTPPTFLWATWDDPIVPCENTLCLASALRENNIPAEVHIYPHGAHGLSLGDRTSWCSDPKNLEPSVTEWPERAAAFLRAIFSGGMN